ncbi:GNAT family N-acetyltransferase [Candidatus Puniceispirillum sp.]|nr:GNAT family N-acetyltransferase [Candidatus Puniceispirillum sp.]
MSIRSLQDGDFQAWKNLWNAYLEFYETTVEDNIYEISFGRILSHQNISQNALIAERDGELVGLVHYIFHPHNWKIEDVCYLQDLYVSPELRGCGVGRALIEAVYAASDARDIPTVYWLTQDFNKPARRLYDYIASVTPFIKYQRR